jgi:uncharacterized membrane protein YgcG
MCRGSSATRNTDGVCRPAGFTIIHYCTKESSMRLYVGNVSRDATEEDLRQAFQAFGQVTEVALVKDKFNGVPKGFAFVEMPVQAEAQKAIEGLTGTDLKGRSLDVNEARPKPERSNRGGGGGGGWGGGGGGRRSGGSGGGGRRW